MIVLIIIQYIVIHDNITSGCLIFYSVKKMSPLLKINNVIFLSFDEKRNIFVV